MFDPHAQLTDFLITFELFSKEGAVTKVVVDVILLVGLFIIAGILYSICHSVVGKTLTNFFRKTTNKQDDILVTSRFIKRFTLLIPAVILWRWAPEVLRSGHASHGAFVLFSVYLIVITLSILFSTLNTFNRVYKSREISREMPITGILQTIKILLTVGAGVMILSVLLGKSPALIFSGFGALTAILMLVFKDPLLGLAAGLQLSSNKLVAVGDWIEVPKYRADGVVLELALTTVKVQNWDKTITTIPTYSLISESFKNWQGMAQSGLRRIKRSLPLDIETIRFLYDDEIEHHKQNPLLADYFTAKEAEFMSSDSTHPQNERRLTNIGTYRAYIYAYLNAHSQISDQGTLLVRQLEPTALGLPIEVYCFCKDNRWVHYEDIQSDIFDHLISILPDFGLRVF